MQVVSDLRVIFNDLNNDLDHLDGGVLRVKRGLELSLALHLKHFPLQLEVVGSKEAELFLGQVEDAGQVERDHRVVYHRHIRRGCLEHKTDSSMGAFSDSNEFLNIGPVRFHTFFKRLQILFVLIVELLDKGVDTGGLAQIVRLETVCARVVTLEHRA